MMDQSSGTFRVVVGLGLILAGMAAPGGTARAAAQAGTPCTLLMTDEIQAVALKASVSEGVAGSPGAGVSTCRYTWGEGVRRLALTVSVSEASRMFPGMSPDLIKKQLQAAVTPDTTDAVISDVGEAAVFKAESAVYVHTAAYAKGRILGVYLDGVDARDRKDELIALLKTAASRL